MQYDFLSHDPALDDPLPAVDRARLLTQLRAYVPADTIVDETEAMRPFECDGLTVYRCLPLVVVLPHTVEQAQSVLRICHAEGVPVVTRGAGTGLSAGALPCANGVLLVLTRLNRILEIDNERRLARVEPGVRNIAISEAVAAFDLYYAPDPSSQLACSIGGNIGENAGGVHCLKYGLTVNNVLALKVLTIEGELLELGGPGLESPGFDLVSLLIGSEGMLGVVVEITVKLLVRPPSTQTMMVSFDDVAAAADTVANIISAGVIPAGLEMMDNLTICAVEEFIAVGYPTDAAALLLVEMDGEEQDVLEQLNQCAEIARETGATAIHVAESEAERARLWRGRKSAFPALARLKPDYYCIDGTIPRSAIAEVLAYIKDAGDRAGFQVANVFHAGDGNLHPLIIFDSNVEGIIPRVEDLAGLIMEKCVAVGGTITGEHGVGREKINQMAAQFGDAEIAQFMRVKEALDPQKLLNPGKNIPTLRRCQEYRSIMSSRAEPAAAGASGGLS